MNIFKSRGLLLLAVAGILWVGLGSTCTPTTDTTSESSGVSGRPASSVDSVDDEDSDDPSVVPPTAGPTELPGPVSLRFPQSITIDLDPFGTVAALTIIQDEEGNDVYLEGVTDLVEWHVDKAEEVLALSDVVFSDTGFLSCLQIPRDTSTTTFQGTACTGSEFAGWDVSIDFAAFASTQTKTSTCSGNTEDLPVCFRVWVRRNSTAGWSRAVAGFMTSLPDDDTGSEGAGWYWLRPGLVNTATSGSLDNAFRWNHIDPSTRATETFDEGTIGGVPESGHALVAEWDSDGSCPLTLFKNTHLGLAYPNGGGPVDLISKHVGSWKDCGFYLGARFDQESDDSSLDITPYHLCARRSDGTVVPDTVCEQEGVDVGGENFLEVSNEDPAFPSQDSFPFSPP